MFCNAAIVAAVLAAVAGSATGPDRAGIVDRIDHEATGFALEGGHQRVACRDCHMSVYRGTPNRCADCHDGIRAEGRGPRHIPVTAACEHCHTNQEWRLSRFDHSDVITSCVRCHNNLTAPGKTPGHPPTSAMCEDCHSTVHWNRLLPGVGLTEPAPRSARIAIR